MLLKSPATGNRQDKDRRRPPFPDWETEAGVVWTQNTGLGSGNVGLARLMLFPFSRGEEGAPLPKPRRDRPVSPQRPMELQWVQLHGALETILCPREAPPEWHRTAVSLAL